MSRENLHEEGARPRRDLSRASARGSHRRHARRGQRRRRRHQRRRSRTCAADRTALTGAGIAPNGIATSSFRITWMIDRTRLDEAVRLLHRTFIEQQPAELHVRSLTAYAPCSHRAPQRLRSLTVTMTTSSTASSATSSYDTQSDEQSTTYPSTDEAAGAARAISPTSCATLGVADARSTSIGYVMATIPATTTKAGVPTIGFIAHVDTSPEMRGRRRQADRAPRLRRPRPGAARRSDRRAAAAGHPGTRRADGPRHRHRVRHDAARRRQQGRRRRNRDGGRLSRGASRDSARDRSASPSRRTRKSAAARSISTSRGSARTAPTRWTAAAAARSRCESFSADAMTVTFHGFNTHPGYAKGRMVNAIKVGRGVHRSAAARQRCRRKRPTATRDSSIRTS